MTGPLVALAAGGVIAAFIGIPHALGGTNAIERFLEPSFTAEVRLKPDATSGPRSPDNPDSPRRVRLQPDRTENPDSPRRVRLQPDRTEAAGGGAQLPLMIVAVLIAGAGGLAARYFYITRPEMPARLLAAWPRLHALLFMELYVDDLYNATVVRGTAGAGRALLAFDRRVVDGAVNASGWLTQIASWISHMLDKHVLDGLVRLVGSSAARGSFFTRRVQTGLVQNYALLMVFGVFALLTAYLLAIS
jgi:NADH-quinone oxidoreductase subunit L